MEIGSLIKTTDRVIHEYEQSLLHLKHLEKEMERNNNQLDEINEEISLLEEVQIFLQELAEVARHQIKDGLEKVVTLCLQAIFGPSMSFEIELDTSRNNTIVRFYVVNTEGGRVVRDSPEDSMGGGVIDTVSIGLRFGLLKILNPEPIGPIILDEPAKMVSNDKVEAVADLLKELTMMFDKQNILVTHQSSIMDVVDNAIYFELKNGATQVSK